MGRTAALRIEPLGRNRLRLLVATALAGFAVAWLAYTQLYVPSVERELAWRDASAPLSRAQFQRPLYEVFRTRAELERFLRRELPGVAVDVPQVDFTHDVAVLLALGPRSSTGYRIEILRVAEERRRVVIEARERAPALRDRTEPRVVYPFRLIVLRDTGKPVALALRGR